MLTITASSSLSASAVCASLTLAKTIQKRKKEKKILYIRHGTVIACLSFNHIKIFLPDKIWLKNFHSYIDTNHNKYKQYILSVSSYNIRWQNSNVLSDKSSEFRY